MKIWPFTRDDKLPPIGKNCAVYYDEERFLVCSDHYMDTRAMNGPGQPCEWFEKNASPESLGMAVLRCLAESRADLSLEECESEINSVCRVANVRTIDNFAKKYCFISLHELETSIEIQLWHPSSIGGYTGVKEDPKYSSDKDVQTIGEVVLLAANNVSHKIVDQDYLEELDHD